MCSATSQKKHKCLDISVKVKVLEFGKQSPKLGTKKLADHFGICKTQIHAVLKNKEAMRDAYASNEIPNHRKRKSSKYSDMNHTLWDWYTMCRKTDILVSGSMLHEKAMLIAATLEISNFVTSNGWCEKVRQKYRICNKTVEWDDGTSAQGKPSGWNACDVWNLDERGCFWRGLPDKTLDAKGRRCTGGEKGKQWITWAFFVNAEGEKEDPVVIGISVSRG